MILVMPSKTEASFPRCTEEEKQTSALGFDFLSTALLSQCEKGEICLPLERISIKTHTHPHTRVIFQSLVN